ncbi:hypothetical protein G9A89_004004 [Geosiphon pyriformis]|nr:hypothetical protein G9A89_004004 [Geosiphon pyriformis]
MPKESNFQQTALSEGKVAAPRSNSSNNTILPAQNAQNVNFSDIFPFEFEANKSSFLLSNATANKQKAITAMYTEATTVNQQEVLLPTTQTVIVTADGIKKTPVREINNFLFTIDGITIPVKVLVMNTPQYQALKIFEELKEWKKVRYSIPEPQKQPPYIPLKCKDCNKKLSLMGACITPKEEYKTYVLPEKYNWIDVIMKGGVCDQTCQYALLISEKVRKGTLFDAVYNSVLNKLYHYLHNAEMIFDLTMTLINGATQEDVHQMKKAEYIEYTIELARFDYKDEVETYYQIASHTYPTQEAQIQ